MNEPESPAQNIGPDYFEAVTKLKALEPSQSDICDALPEECAVEATGVHGEKRIDFEKVPIKDASGDLNQYGKNLIDMHQPAAVAGSELTKKLAGGDFAPRPQTTGERERKQPLDPNTAERIAKTRNLMRVHSKRRFRGLHVCDSDGVPNLWLDERGRLVRIALVGTRQSQRVEIVSA